MYDNSHAAIVAGTAPVDTYASGNDSDMEYTLPFTFPFNGKDIVKINVNTNGLIELLESGESCYECSNDGTHYNGAYIGHMDAIFASNDDLVGAVEVKALTLPDRVVIEWIGSTAYDFSVNSPLHFQVVLFSDGGIRWNFKSMNWSGYSYDMYSGIYFNGGTELNVGYAINAEQVSYEFNPDIKSIADITFSWEFTGYENLQQSGGVTTTSVHGDDNYTECTLPFTFPFNGKGIVKVGVNTNGLIELLETGESCYECSNYGTHYNGTYVGYIDAVFASNDDLITNVEISNLSDSVVIDWAGNTYVDDITYPIHFEVVLFSDGRIHWNFRTMAWSGYSYDMYTGVYFDGGTAQDVGYKINTPQSSSYFPPQFTLTVTKTGTGSGTLTSLDGLINCGSDCSSTYNYSSSVTLTAAADTNSSFAGWSGACTGAGTCSVTMDKAKTVTATFNDNASPTGSISINNDATYTISTAVTLTLSATDSNNVSQMCISNTTTCSSWETYTTSKSWTLASGDGDKKVYVWLRDGLGNANPNPYSDSIILDTTAPTDGILSVSAGNSQVSLDWSGFSDATSGISSYTLVYGPGSTPISCSSGTPIYPGTKTSYTHTGLTNGTTYYYRVCATDNAENISTGTTANATPLQTYITTSINCSDSGIQCIRRTDGGDDSNNLVDGNPRVDVEYEFIVSVTDTGGTPQYIRLYMAQRSSPSSSDFYGYDMVCSGSYNTGATCTYRTKLGPAAVHKFYIGAKFSDSSTITYPDAGYITGPQVQLLTGYNMVSIPRDVNSSNLDGTSAFGSSSTYRWTSTGLTTDSNKGAYSLVDSSNPVVNGEGYFSSKQNHALLELGNYGEVQGSYYTYKLNPGWNIISTPYDGNVMLKNLQVKKGNNSPVSWTTAVTNGWLINAIYYYNGSDWGETYSFESAGGNPDATLIPWLGYWVYLNNDDDTYYLAIQKP